MGYTTEFEGQFKLDTPLTEAQGTYIRTFSETRRMKRVSHIAEEFDDPLRLAVDLPIGTEGEFYVSGFGDFGQGRDMSIIDYNEPPASQPGLWCQWVPTEDLQGIEWDGNEEFYNYVEWLEYIIENFLERWGYKLNGEIFWQGEETGDVGKIIVTDNKVEQLSVVL